MGSESHHQAWSETFFATVNQHHFRAISSDIIICLKLLNLKIWWEFILSAETSTNSILHLWRNSLLATTLQARDLKKPGAPARLKSVVPNKSMCHRLRYRCLVSPLQKMKNEQTNIQKNGRSKHYFKICQTKNMKQSCSQISHMLFWSQKKWKRSDLPPF